MIFKMLLVSQSEVMARIFIFCGFVQGRQDFPFDARAFSLTSFEACSSLNKDKSWTNIRVCVFINSSKIPSGSE